MQTYHAPIRCLTGSLVQQPAIEASRSDWYFDAHWNHQATGFLDAPAQIPSGGVRACDCVSLTLGIAHHHRDLRSPA